MTNSADPDQPTDLDLHCLLRQGMFCSAREGLINLETCANIQTSCLLALLILKFEQDHLTTLGQV